MASVYLTEEKEQFRKLASDFARAEIAPRAERFDDSGEFPEELLRKCWELGLVNCQIPEALGGMELDTLDSCLILEELAAGCSGISAAVEASAIALLPLLRYGTDQQKETFLEPLADGPALAGYASQDATTDDVTVGLQPNGKFRLNGSQSALVNGGHAAWYLVVAVHEEDEAGDDTLDGSPSSVFAVPGDTDGFSIEERLSTLGRRCRVVRRAEFKDVELDESHLIGEPGSARQVINQILPQLQVVVAASAIGVARSAMQHAISYAKQRQTFGRPIAQHQGVAFMLADMAREIEAARLMTWQAAALIDAGIGADNQSLAAKAFAQDMAMRVTTDAVQVFGGYGYSKEYPVEKLMRDAKMLQMCELNSQDAKAALARQLVSTHA